jgi:zinc D-Ala-D-Ala carboxypeptidase
MYTTGAKLNEKDYRDILIAKVQSPVDLPKDHITDISMIPVMNQRNIGACVGHAIATSLAYLNHKETGKAEYLSPRFIYGLAKQLDGRPDEEGTQPRIGAKITTDLGCALDKDLPNDTFLTHKQYTSVDLTEALKLASVVFKTKGYAFVPITEEALKQAIFQNGVVTITIGCGRITSKEIKKGNENGYHYICVYGYEKDGNDTIFHYRNSWGSNWGKKGNGKFSFKDFTGFMFDAITYVDTPNQLKEEARAGYRYFKQYEIVGLKPELVKMLDDARHIAGIPFKINSGFRTKEHNKKVGGVEDSAHLTGLAVDISCTNDSNRYKIVTALLAVGFNRIGWAKTFIHADCDTSKSANVIWLYD